MKWKNNLFFLFMSFLILLFLYALSFDIEGNGGMLETSKISVISRENKSEAFERIRQGMEQAGQDLGVELSFILLTEKNNAQEQAELLEREINSGASAIILSAADQDTLLPVVEKYAGYVPIFYMESPLETDKIAGGVLGDDFQMGRTLGEQVIYKGLFDKRVLILESSRGCTNISARKEGLVQELEKGKATLLFQEIPEGENQKQLIEKAISEAKPDILVALEATVLVSSAEILQNTNHSLRLYGISALGKTAPFIEKQIIDTVVIQNDFNMGYLSVRGAAAVLRKESWDKNSHIAYGVVNGYNMYSDKNQSLVFPFVR